MIKPQTPPAGGLRRILLKVFSFPVFLGAMVCACAVAMTVWDQAPVIAGKIFVEGDTWWHLAVGEQILSAHVWPTHDIYSFTVRGSPWIAYEWLGEVVMALATRIAKVQGLAVLLVILAVGMGLLIYYYAWLRSRNCKAAAIATILVLPVASATFTMRPQLMGYVLLLITLICLERFQQGHARALWILPAVYLIWGNVHGNFILGLFVLGVYWVTGLAEFRLNSLEAVRRPARQRIQLSGISLLCLLSIMVTPYGARLAVYPVESVTQQRFMMEVTTEWESLQFSTDFGRVFLLLILAILLLQVVAPASYKLETLVLLLFTIVESCIHARFLVFFAIIAAPVLATYSASWLPPYKPDKDHPIANAILIGAVAVMVVVFFPSSAKLQRILAATFPVGAVQYLKQHPEVGNMYNTDVWGSYLIWANPERKVFIDGRFDIYQYGGVLQDYFNLTNFRGNLDSVWGKYDLQAALVKHGDPMSFYLQASPHWKVIYQDPTSMIFSRVDEGLGARTRGTRIRGLDGHLSNRADYRAVGHHLANRNNQRRGMSPRGTPEPRSL